jgi:hypothetical protein
MGMIVLTMMLATEVAGSVYISKKDWNGLTDWVSDRDAVAGPVYFALLVIFAAMPACISMLQEAERPDNEKTTWMAEL